MTINYAPYIDHTLLKCDATESDIKKVCDEAIKYQFCSVCVNSSYASLTSQQLKGTQVKTCCVVGFPLGACLSEVKAFETEQAILNGADEIDMVINLGFLKSHHLDLVKKDIQMVKNACNGKTLKVILETCLLTRDEIIAVCNMCKKIGVEFVKTSTGFSTGGATIEDVELMKQTVGQHIEVKASGGIRDQKTAQAMIDAGATRLGTSAGIAIISNQKSTSSY